MDGDLGIHLNSPAVFELRFECQASIGLTFMPRPVAKLSCDDGLEAVLRATFPILDC